MIGLDLFWEFSGTGFAGRNLRLTSWPVATRSWSAAPSGWSSTLRDLPEPCFCRGVFTIKVCLTILTRSASLFAIALLISACGVIKEKQQPDPLSSEQLAQKPLKPEQAQEVLEETGKNWLYGQGLGSTILNVGAVVLFPPYALYLVGNGILSVSGYEPLYVTDALPETAREGYNEVYDGVTSVPGKLAAAAADEKFRNSDEAAAKIKAVLAKANVVNAEQGAREGATAGNLEESDPRKLKPKRTKLLASERRLTEPGLRGGDASRASMVGTEAASPKSLAGETDLRVR